MTTADHYTFGDTTTAADRLRLLAAVYEPATRDLLRRWAPASPSHALDLGCGPGYSTRLLHDVTRARRTTGVDRSHAYVQRALATEVPGITFVEHDVTDVPLPVAPADVVFARYLLTHLSDPAGVLRGWARALRAGGRMILQETAALRSGDPALARYYELVGDLQRHHGQDLTVGARLGQLAHTAGLRVTHSAVSSYRPLARVMARLHALNLRTWRDDPYARATFDPAELDELGQRLDRLAEAASQDATVEHSLGELVIDT